MHKIRSTIKHNSTSIYRLLRVKDNIKVNGHLVSEGKIICFYGTKSDKHGYPQFLVHEDNTWAWISAKHFDPLT